MAGAKPPTTNRFNWSSILKTTAIAVHSYMRFVSGSSLGAYLDKHGALRYTDDSKEWFDLSLISSTES